MILVSIAGFIAGIVLGSFFFPAWTLVLFFLATGFIFLSQIGSDKERHRRILACAVFFFAFSFGCARMHLSMMYQSSSLQRFVGEKVLLSGIIDDEPDVRDHATQLTIRADHLSLASTTWPVNEKILISVPLYPEFSYGDRVRVETTLSLPEMIASDGGRVFDYPNYLRARGIYIVGSFPRISFVESGQGNPVKNFLFNLKHRFTRAVSRVIPEPESDLLGGLLLGAKQSLGQALLMKFSQAGVSHVVVLSGYNIAIVAESIMVLLAFLPAAAAFMIGVASIILFILLSGGGASAIRAAIMVIAALFAAKTNREYSPAVGLCIAVVCMLAYNPMLLVFDPSFQLSILATIGIIFVSPIIQPYLRRVPERYGLQEIISSTVATQLIVLPYLIYTTGIVSLVSLPVNALILGTVPATMFLGFVTGLFGLFSPYLAYIPALPTYILLWYQLAVVRVATAIPFGFMQLPAFSFIIVVGIYVFIGWGLYLVHTKTRTTSGS